MTFMELIQSPKGAALLGMTSASALHFAAYEFARSAIIAMFTSKKTGFISDGAMPFATGCISPFSILLLCIYSSTLEAYGPRSAMKRTSLLCAGNLVIGGLIMRYVESKISESTAPLHSLSRACIFFLFISENAFVQLLFTQHWAFLGSIGQGKKEGSVWFAPVAGIGSLSSTLAASAVGRMVEVFSLSGVLILSSFIMLMSGASAEYAYIMAEKNGFDPHPESTNKKSSNQQHLSLVKRTEKLFARIPVLKFLCGEVVVCQCLSALVTFLFLRQMKMSVTDDLQRAGWTGNCYALINGASGVLQFVFIPLLVTRVDPRRLWAVMPAVMLLFSIYMVLTREHSLAIVASSFCTMKVLEYSLRGVANEMLFASLDYESRYVAKQEIALLANRFSKSFTAVSLSLLTKYITSSFVLDRILSWASAVFASLWLVISLQLTRIIFSKSAKEKAL